MHWFRHTFIKRLKRATTHDSLRYDMGGHEHGNEHEDTYGSVRGMEKEAFRELSKVEFPVDIAGLKLDWKKPETIREQIKEKLKQLS